MTVLNLTSRKPIYGWIPDLPDHRDKLYAKLTAVTWEELPAKVDLRPNCTSVQDQGQLGSCTANALAGNLDYLKKQQLRKTLNFSRLFIYYNERVIEHTVSSDSGAMIRDGIKTLVKQGACPESEWPYDVSKFTDQPTPKDYTDALKYLITSYYRLSGLPEMKHTLSLNYPFVFGFSVYESFENREVAQSGIVPLPANGERLLGGHAVMAVGFDDASENFIVRNSWGVNWGQNDYCLMPYSYLTNPNLASDFWTIRDMERANLDNKIRL